MPRRRRLQSIQFVGRGNDACTQMAEGLAKALLKSLGVTVRNAGLSPTRLSPWAGRATAEVDIDISAQASKPLDTVVASMIDTLILVEPGLALPPRCHRIPSVAWRIDDRAAVSVSSDADVGSVGPKSQGREMTAGPSCIISNRKPHFDPSTAPLSGPRISAIQSKPFCDDRVGCVAPRRFARLRHETPAGPSLTLRLIEPNPHRPPIDSQREKPISPVVFEQERFVLGRCRGAAGHPFI